MSITLKELFEKHPPRLEGLTWYVPENAAKTNMVFLKEKIKRGMWVGYVDMEDAGTFACAYWNFTASCEVFVARGLSLEDAIVALNNVIQFDPGEWAEDVRRTWEGLR